MKLYIVQADYSGIPDDPQVFLDEAQADAAYEAYLKEFGYADDDEMWEGFNDETVRYWVVEPTPPAGPDRGIYAGSTDPIGIGLNYLIELADAPLTDDDTRALLWPFIEAVERLTEWYADETKSDPNGLYYEDGSPASTGR